MRKHKLDVEMVVATQESFNRASMKCRYARAMEPTSRFHI